MMMSWFISLYFSLFPLSLSHSLYPQCYLSPSSLSYEFEWIIFLNISRYYLYLAPINDTVLGMTSEWIVVITICTLLMMLACGVGISICICRRNTNRNIVMKGSQMTTTTMSNDVNGQKHLNFYRPAVLGEWLYIFRVTLLNLSKYNDLLFAILIWLLSLYRLTQ